MYATVLQYVTVYLHY